MMNIEKNNINQNLQQSVLNKSIKNICLYNKDLYKQVIKKEKKKIIIYIIVCLMIMLISTFAMYYIITNDLIKNLVILYFILMTLAIIFFFIFFYNCLSLGSILVQKEIFLDRVYVITNNDEIITFKYARKEPYFRYKELNGNLLDEIVHLVSLQISVNKENKTMTKKIKENNIVLNDLYECLYITNVYEIKEKEDCIEIVCDYIDLIINTSCKRQLLKIYKYYENWEELLDNLKKQKEKINK